MILSVSNIDKSFGDTAVLTGVSFLVNEHEKVALIGRNGAGKSTLFKIIMGELSADTGTITVSRDAHIGYLSQHQDITGDRTVFEEVHSVKDRVFAMEARMRLLEENMKHAEGEALDAMYREYNAVSHEFEQAGGYAAESEVVGVLRGLGFDESNWDKRASVLSGGQKTRVALAKLLLEAPDLLLLDEPTNHLDLNSVAWLETFLSNYKGAVLIVSHDRYFLNKIVTKVVELERTKAMVFPGNYDEFAAKKAMIRDAERKAYEKQQAEIHHQEEVIAKLRSFGREKQIKRAESRVKMLEKMDRLEKPAEEESGMVLKLTPHMESGNDVLIISDLAKSYNAQKLFEHINLLIRKGEKVALLGDNGTGKTTLLKIVRGLVEPDAGTVRFGAKVCAGYYDQEQQNFNEQNTYELEKWDYMKTGYTAEVGISETLYKLFEWQSVNGTDPYFNKVDRKVMKILRKCYEDRYEPFGGKTRHRAFLWGPSAVYYTDFPTWIQNCWGIAIVLNMDSTMGFNMIDTEDKEKALDDLALLTTKACMRHMAVGGWDNINAVWEWAHNFNCDMVLMNDNIACKGMLGVHSVMEEQARELGFHFIFIEHDLEDSRTVSRQNMRDCVNQYMSIVLGEEPLDPTIVAFDDSDAY